jgi:DUF971 family protein
MQPVQLTPIGTELALKWSNGEEAFIPLETLRRACPCASCQGETDVMGTVHRPPQKPYGPGSFQLVQCALVGGYGFQPRWADGHGTGIDSWDYLRRLAERSREVGTGPG